jgi:hypothetical protein
MNGRQQRKLPTTNYRPRSQATFEQKEKGWNPFVMLKAENVLARPGRRSAVPEHSRDLIPAVVQ